MAQSRCWQSSAALVALALILSACHREAPAKIYHMRGAIVSVDIASKIAVINNEKIAGWMEPMTMEYPVHDAELLKGLAPGDHVTADVYVSGDLAYWLENLKKL
jgi:Cu/Ag efflux protein CusF